MRYWLVEMCNAIDRQDDEVWKIRAVSKSSAKQIARSSDMGRFETGAVIQARGGTKRDRALAKEFRTYCTRVFP
jgi:hypothetical protein